MVRKTRALKGAKLKSSCSQSQATKRANKLSTAPGSRTAFTTPDPSPSSLLDQSRLTTDEWYKSKRTTKAYANYVKNGKSFLATWVQDSEECSEGEGLDHVASEERAVYSGAFDNITDKTPTALRLLMAYKCDHQGKGFSTAEGLRSAFKLYFERCVLHCIITSYPSSIGAYIQSSRLPGRILEVQQLRAEVGWESCI
jgi:hypothetical protein